MCKKESKAPLQRSASRLAGCWKSLLQAAQKDPDARRAKNRRAEAYLQYVAARRLSGNEAYGSFQQPASVVSQKSVT